MNLKKTNKSWKTNLLGYVGLIILLGSFTFVAVGKATFGEIAVVLGASAAFLTTIGNFLAKDATASHTYSNRTLDPDKDEYPKEKF